MKEDGFEYKLPGDETATFFKWSVSDGGKDIILIDKFTAMPIQEFFQTVEESDGQMRGPVMLALVATSIRAARPDWTPERIVRIVQNLSLSELAYIDADKEKQDPPTVPVSTGESSPGESKSSATHPGPSEYGTSNLTPV